MPKLNLDDTIAAVSTPIGEGGIGIVRMSGKEALSIADKIFISKDKKRPADFKTYTTHYGHIADGSKIIDEVILTVMRSPRSYTREDIAEINCHGGIVALRKVLDLVLAKGCRLAEPGEFTRRAFLNGRIDLVQAEAVLDIIRAKTQKGLEIALLELEGGPSKYVRDLKEKLLDVKVHLEASIDFPDEELPAGSHKKLESRLSAIKTDLENFIKSSETGKIIREGITCVICGKPNVGKSSLMNELLKEERVIVTPIPGTTRDAICEYINVDDIPLQIVDTAGIVKTENLLEREGIIRSKLYLERADLILFMMDKSTDFSNEDKEIIELIKDKEVICVINKGDLERRLNINAADLNRHFGKSASIVEISVLKKINLGGLRKCITDAVWKGKVFANDFNILANARHKDSVLKALGFVNEAIFSLRENQPEEIISISIDEAIGSLAEVIGERISEEVLDRIFEQFCIGK